MQKLQGWVEQGNTQLLITGAAGTISRRVQGSYPLATVTVYINGPPAIAISAISRTSNVVTVTVPSGSGFIAGQNVTIAGVADVSFNGTFAILSATPTTLTYAQTGANATSSGGNAFSTLRLATIFADNTSTPKANPFTAGADATWFFYVPGGDYDIRFSGAGIASPFTVSDVSVFDPNSGFLQPYPGAVPRSINSKMGDFISVKDFGAQGNALADDSAAFQAAVNAVPAGGMIYVPRGTYVITQTILIPNSRVSLFGDGQQASIIHFQPTGTASCLKLESSTSFELAQNRIQGIAIDGTGDTHIKTAIELIDVEEIEVTDFAVSNWTDPGKTSVGILTEGRQTIKLYRVTISAPAPIVIAKNPKAGGDSDHFHFEDCYLTADSNPCITIQEGVNISNFTCDGYQAWVLGTYGLYYNSSSSTFAGINIAIHNARWEQSTNATGYIIYLSSTNNIYNVEITNCYGGTLLNHRGYFFRHIFGLRAVSLVFGGQLEALNVDNTVYGEISGFFGTPGSTMVTTGYQGVLDDFDIQGTRRILSKRFSLSGGVGINSANDLVLGLDGNQFHLSGGVQVNAITTTGWQAGSRVTLIFDANTLVKHFTAGGPNTARIILVYSADYPFQAGNTLSLEYDGNFWWEVGRTTQYPTVTNNAPYIGLDNAGNPIYIARITPSNLVEFDPFNHGIQFGGSIIGSGGGAALTFGTAGGAGPASGAQLGWMQFFDASGSPVFIPVWR